MRRKAGKFNKILSGQAIEQTINRDQKCPGGIIGFSTSKCTVQRWSLISHVAAKSQSQLEEFLGMAVYNCVTKDLAQKRILFDDECTTRSYELVKDWGTPFKETSKLVHLCSGLECSDDVQRDLINAEKKEKEAMINFIEKRIESREKDIFSPIPKMKLKTFSSMKTKKSCRVEDRNITIKADRDIFARLLVIGGKREVSLRDVLTYSLGPIPWSLATADGSLAKKNKAKLLDAIENETDDPCVNEIPNYCVRVYDGMVVIQQTPSTSLETFGDMSKYVLKRITSAQHKFIYFTTDQYREDSLKSCERKRRAPEGSIRIRITRRDQKIPKQFKTFLGNGCNKVNLVRFFLQDWSDAERFKAVIAHRVLFITLESRAYRLEVKDDEVKYVAEESLYSNQEEADTKMFFCSQHAIEESSCRNICISTVDSDVGILASYYKNVLSSNLFLQIGSKGKKRILDISEMHERIRKDVSDALPALHALSGCDCTSAFFGIGKQKMYKVVKKYNQFKDVLPRMGGSVHFEMDIFLVIQEMISECYAVKSCKSINDVRYKKFCTKTKAPEPQQLPPTEDELLFHCQRANYATYIWKFALVPNVNFPRPNGFGWTDVNNQLEIKWMSKKPPQILCWSLWHVAAGSP